MEKLFWEVQYLSPPKTIRYCKKCSMKTEHISAGLFRVNAQQKSLDIWLIYRCASCKTTWNSAVYSRVNPKSLDHKLLNRFMNNDSELAQKYAMDTVLLKKLVCSGVIRLENGTDIHKCKIQRDTVILINGRAAQPNKTAQ